ncbi:MAG: oligosaccharide flippase family protein [Deltaproteobacteria bacterium]|nr:oligosaccharide flippase family protein [Deltaproteobacteria bacterium]
MPMRNRSILRNTSYLGVSTLASYLLLFGSTILIARLLGPDSFGKVSVAQMAGVCICILTDGMKLYGVRSIARAENEIHLVDVKGHFFMLCRAAIIILLLATVVIMMLPVDADYRLLLLTMIGSSMLMAALYVDWIFQGREMMGYIAVANVLRYLLYVVILIVCLSLDRNIYWVGISTLIATLVSCAYLLANVQKTGFSLFKRPLNHSSSFQGGGLGEHFILGLTTLRNQIFYAPTTIIFGMTGHNVEAGIYNAGFKLAFFLSSLGNVYMQSMFPRVCAYCATDRGRLKELIGRSTRLILFLALPVGVGVTMLSGDIVQLVFGESFAAAAGVLSVLIWAVLIMLTSYNFSTVLIGFGRQDLFIKVIAGIALLNILLTSLLLDLIGTDVVWLSLAAEGIVLLLLIVSCKKLYNVSGRWEVMIPAIGSILMGITLYSLKNTLLLLSIIAGIAVYTLFVIYIARISPRELLKLEN